MDTADSFLESVICIPYVMGKGLEVAWGRQPIDPGYVNCFASESVSQALFLPKINPEFIGLSVHSPCVARAR